MLLGDVCDICKKSVNPKAGTIYNLYSLPAFDNEKRPEIVDGETIKSSKFIVEQDVILLNKLNVRFKRIWNIYEEPPCNSICSTEFIPVKPHNIHQFYLYYILTSSEFTKAMESCRTGTSSSHQRISADDFLNFTVSLPSAKEQNEIGDTLKLLAQYADNNINMNRRLEQIAREIFIKNSSIR